MGRRAGDGGLLAAEGKLFLLASECVDGLRGELDAKRRGVGGSGVGAWSDGKAEG